MSNQPTPDGTVQSNDQRPQPLPSVRAGSNAITSTSYSPTPDKPTELDNIFFQELRGKTVTPEFSKAIEWVERRVKPAIVRWHDAALQEQANQSRLEQAKKDYAIGSLGVQDGTFDAYFRSEVAALQAKQQKGQE